LFRIYDGREHFYQWDVDRKLIIEDATITQVHFCNRTDTCSLVCETYQENGLTLVNVPNILLQTDWRINVYAYDTNYTKFNETYDVVRRTKPTDYVYTETEVLNYNTLLEKMTGIEENIAGEVENYLKENPVEVDLTGYATEQYVTAAITEIELTPGPQGEPGKDFTYEDFTEEQLAALKGADGEPGKDGYTPQKGIDYFDGKDGEPGKDGYTPVKGVDYFDGEPGPAGEDGKDYVLTEADKAEIAGMVEVTGGGGGDHPVKAGTGANSVMSLGAAKASGRDSVALGSVAHASGDDGIAIGSGANANGAYSAAIGLSTEAAHSFSTALGYGAITSNTFQVVIGPYNAKDSTAAVIIGCGTMSDKKNGLTIDKNQIAHFPGSVVIGENKEEVATKAYVDEHAGSGGGVTEDRVNELINEALGVIENGTY
jgi:hypothetical protein